MRRPPGIRPDIHARFELVYTKAMAAPSKPKATVKVALPDDGVLAPDQDAMAIGCHWKRPLPSLSGDDDPSFEGILTRDEDAGD